MVSLWKWANPFIRTNLKPFIQECAVISLVKIDRVSGEYEIGKSLRHRQRRQQQR